MSNLKLVFWLVLFAAGATFSNENTEVEQWTLLMQYQRQNDGFKSKIKKSAFFISPNGHIDPANELQESLILFQKILPASNTHPQCVFPARYRVLRKSFSLAAPVFCQDFSDWKERYQMSYASLFYAGPYMSSPSSVFGHSFLLLGSAKTEAYSQLTFNYAADIPSDVSAFDYAYRGIGGGFPGVISILPFYQRLYQYTDMENRDLWEYRLNLAADEVDLLAAYLWEIKTQANFDYYFFDENCASILLWILKAVKPDFNIETSNGVFVLPTEVTQVAHRENLVASVVYHPALLKRLNAKFNQMKSDEKKSFQQTLTDHNSTNGASLLVLEALLDHLNIERHRGQGELAVELKPLEREVLLQRSQLKENPLAFNASETPLKPHSSNLPVRLQAGPVIRNGITGSFFNFRPGVHEWLEYDGGYLPNSTVRILEVEILAANNQRLRLQKLTWLGLANHPTVDFYQSPPSWSVEVHIRQNDFNPETQLFGEMAFAGGYSLKAGNFLYYAEVMNALRTNQAPPLGHFEIGPRLGFIYAQGFFKANASAAYLWQASGAQQPAFAQFNAALSYSLSPQWSVSAGYFLVRDPDKNFQFDQSKASLDYYF